jgi:hypothetical protein
VRITCFEETEKLWDRVPVAKIPERSCRDCTKLGVLEGGDQVLGITFVLAKICAAQEGIAPIRIRRPLRASDVVPERDEDEAAYDTHPDRSR